MSRGDLETGISALSTYSCFMQGLFTADDSSYRVWLRPVHEGARRSKMFPKIRPGVDEMARFTGILGNMMLTKRKNVQVHNWIQPPAMGGTGFRARF